MLRAILFLSLAAAVGCGDNLSLESGAPDSGVSSVPGDDPGDDVGDEPVDEEEEEEEGGLACTLEEIEPIFTCVLENCLDLGGLGDLGDLGGLEDLLPGGIPGLPGGGDEGGEGGGGLPGLPGGEGGGFDTGEILECAALSCFPEILAVSGECKDCLFELIAGGDNALEVCGGDLGGIPGLPGGGGEGGEGGGFPGGLPF